MKLRYFYAGLIIIVVGLLVNFEASLLSETFLRRNLVFEVPRKDFRLHVERVWEGDIIRLEFEVEGGDRDLYVTVDRTHFYIGPRQEYGAPTMVLTLNLLGPELIKKTETLTFDIDLEGHLNIVLNNTLSTMPKTVTYRRVFERSTNLEYGTRIVRNMSILTSIVFFIIAIVENYEYIKGILRKPVQAEQVAGSLS
ncbi:MAG: hypothetical protein PVJ38_06830 [Candidatus Bathyarchaeota archaeon]